jgi:Asp/Glu/hydantoin racemase
MRMCGIMLASMHTHMHPAQRMCIVRACEHASANLETRVYAYAYAHAHAHVRSPGWMHDMHASVHAGQERNE